MRPNRRQSRCKRANRKASLHTLNRRVPTALKRKITRCVNKAAVAVQSINANVFKEYNPICFAQYTTADSKWHVKEYATFSGAVDEFYYVFDSQKLEQAANAAETEADRKLNDIKKDHVQRIKALEEVQDVQEQRAYLLESNKEIVDTCLMIVR